MADTNTPERSATGVYLDTAANKVVDSPPVEGVQLCAPGGELTPAIKAEIERHKAATATVEESVTDPEPESSEPAKKAPARKG